MPLGFFFARAYKKGGVLVKRESFKVFTPLSPLIAGDILCMKSLKHNDNEKLLELQEEYLKTKSQESWNELFSLSITVCRNIVVSEFIKKKKHFTQEELYNYAVDACIYVLRRYKSYGYSHGFAAPKNYCIQKNYISALKYGVKHALYYTNLEMKNFNRAVSFESISYKIPFCKDNKML